MTSSSEKVSTRSSATPSRDCIIGVLDLFIRPLHNPAEQREVKRMPVSEREREKERERESVCVRVCVCVCVCVNKLVQR